MEIVIKRYLDDAILFECEAESVREACEKAATQGKNLTRADLTGAVLTGAVLTGADLTGAVLTGAVLTRADLTRADLTGAVLTGADLTRADLTGAVLTRAVLTGAVLTRADLTGADLTGAVLTRAVLEPIRVDFFDVLLRGSTNGEVPYLIAALKEGRVNGSSYEGACACLVGTFANAKRCHFREIPDLKPDNNRPAERFFLGIKTGDTPETNPISKIVMNWAEDFMRLLNRAKTGHTA